MSIGIQVDIRVIPKDAWDGMFDEQSKMPTIDCKRYYRIVGGDYAGMIGRMTGVLGGFVVLLVQTRDQWLLAYARPENIKPILRWGLILTNGTTYVEELK